MVNFIPDVYGDLVFNDVASNVTRQSFLGGVQFDGSYRLNEAHTLRAGFAVTAEQTNVDNLSVVLPVDANGDILPVPVAVNDYDAKLGWNIGGYIQDEWKITDKLTLNGGLRFDQLYQFVTANQVSPALRLSTSSSPTPPFTPALRAISRRRCRRRRRRQISPFSTTQLSSRGFPGQPRRAGAVALFRCRHQPENRAEPHGRRRCLPETRDRPSRRRAVRPGRRPDPVQLRSRLYRRAGIQGQLLQRRLHRLCQFRDDPDQGDRHRLEPISHRSGRILLSPE